MEKIPLGLLRIEGAQEERIKRMKVSEKIDDNGLVVSDKKSLVWLGKERKSLLGVIIRDILWSKVCKNIRLFGRSNFPNWFPMNV